jgi:hypothetical protein
VVIHGLHRDLVFRDNTIGHSQQKAVAGPGIRASREAVGLQAEENQFLHVTTPIEGLSRKPHNPASSSQRGRESLSAA